MNVPKTLWPHKYMNIFIHDAKKKFSTTFCVLTAFFIFALQHQKQHNRGNMPNPENIKKHQFKKGESGNPKGRPKGFPNLRNALEEAIYNAPDGENKIQKIANRLLDKAEHGDMRAIQYLFSIIYPDGVHKYEKDKAIDELFPFPPKFKSAKDEVNFYESL